MRFDATITLGTLVEIGSIATVCVAGYYAFSERLKMFEQMLAAHAERLDKHDQLILDLVGKIQRVMGQQERGRR